MSLWQAINWIEAAKKQQLRATLLAMQSCDATNCWWGEYQAAQLLLPMVMRKLSPNVPVKPGRGATSA